MLLPLLAVVALAQPTAEPVARPLRDAVLEGIALDPDGRPIQGLVLQVLPQRESGGSAVDPDGRPDHIIVVDGSPWQDDASRARSPWGTLRRHVAGSSQRPSVGDVTSSRLENRLATTDAEGRFAFEGLEHGAQVRVVDAGRPRIDYASAELRVPARGVRIEIPVHRIELELHTAPGDDLKAAPWCERMTDAPPSTEETLLNWLDDPLHDGAGTWTFFVRAGERYGVGFADLRHALVERAVSIEPGVSVTRTRLDVERAVEPRALVVRVTAPDGAFAFAKRERLRFSVLAPESGHVLWEREVESDGAKPAYSYVPAPAPTEPGPRGLVPAGTSFVVPPGRYIVRASPWLGRTCFQEFWTDIVYHSPVERVVEVGAYDVELELPFPSGGRVHVVVELPEPPGMLDLFGPDEPALRVLRDRGGTLEAVSTGITPSSFAYFDRPDVLTEILETGPVDLVVELPGFEPARVRALVERDRVARIDVRLVPVATPR